MTAMSEIGKEPSLETARWQQAASELAPEKSAPRVAAHAKFVVATVAVVGTVLSTAGLVSADRLGKEEPPRDLALAAACLALAAVITALLTATPRLTSVNLNNLASVRRWYEKELRRGIWAAIAGWILVAAVVIAGVAGITAATLSTPVYQVGLKVSYGTKRTVSATASANDLNSGAVAIVQVAGESRSGKKTVLAESRGTADANGALAIDTSVELSRPFSSYTVVLTVDGEPKSTMRIPAQ